MRQDEASKLLALSARADHLAEQLARQRITQAEYVEQLNAVRAEFGLPPLSVEPGEPRRDKQIQQAIEISLERDISVSELAKAVGLSAPRLSHLFRLTTGILPRDHLRIMKEYRKEQRLAVEILGDRAPLLVIWDKRQARSPFRSDTD